MSSPSSTCPPGRRSAPKPCGKASEVTTRSTEGGNAMTDDKAELLPYLCCNDAAAAMDFYKKAFGADEMFRMEGEGGKIGHATMQILGATFYLSDEWPEGNVYGPQTLGGSPVALHLNVPDVDSVFDQAVAAGASAQPALDGPPHG